MKMMLRRDFFVLATASLLLGGCSIMHFKNGNVEPGGRLVEKWHHSAAYKLYELSAPLDMTSLCKNRSWSMITTKETLVTGVAGMVGGVIWNPQMVEYTCGE